MKTRTLTGRLKMTVMVFTAAMIAMWLFFYLCINKLISDYTLRNLERAAEHGITQLNSSFLQMEQLYFAISSDEEITDIFSAEEGLAFHNAVARAESRLDELIRGKSFLSSIIVYSEGGDFCRLRGKISNTGVNRLLRLIEGSEDDYIRAVLDGERYIGYITREAGGGFVMLMREADIMRLFDLNSYQNISFALSAGEEIAASDGSATLAEFLSGAERTRSARIGSTPFTLWASYTDKGGYIHILFMLAMALMALFLFLLLRVFLRFWQRNFFSPIQTVIDGVESFDSLKGSPLPPTGQEHIDGLIRGINDMAQRIEAKDKALVVSLKKQINAHFIFNILNIIKALSEKGESRKAGELCEGLSLLLRYANGGENFISGMDEFHVLNKYVEIMQIRYPKRFSAEIELDDYLDDIFLPRMLLQPLVENSIVHGLIGGGKNGTVRVFALEEGENVRFVVEDDGRGMSQSALDDLRRKLDEAPLTEPESEGLENIALVNIERRVKFYFGGDYGLEVLPAEGGGTRVELLLPRKSRAAG